jgi:tetratricopeptide (TPR) repeat protein
VNTDRTAQPLEESFELEAPFDASPRLSAADPSLLRPLPLDVALDGTIDETAPTLPLSSAPRVEAPPPVASWQEAAGGGRGVPAAPVARPEPAVAPPPAPAVASPPVPAMASPPVPAAAPPSVPRSATPPAPPAPPVVVPETAALSSSTLAELYFRQGFVDKAIEVYQQLLQREPENERSRARLGELRALLAPSVPPTVVPPAAAAAEDERTTRRRAIESAIARLEDLLVTIRRNAPATGPR